MVPAVQAASGCVEFACICTQGLDSTLPTIRIRGQIPRMSVTERRQRHPTSRRASHAPQTVGAQATGNFPSTGLFPRTRTESLPPESESPAAAWVWAPKSVPIPRLRAEACSNTPVAPRFTPPLVFLQQRAAAGTAAPELPSEFQNPRAGQRSSGARPRRHLAAGLTPRKAALRIPAPGAAGVASGTCAPPAARGAAPPAPPPAPPLAGGALGRSSRRGARPRGSRVVLARLHIAAAAEGG